MEDWFYGDGSFSAERGIESIGHWHGGGGSSYQPSSFIQEAEREYEQRLHNTYDAIAANRALQNGDTQRLYEILDSNSSLQLEITPAKHAVSTVVTSTENNQATADAFIHTLGLDGIIPPASLQWDTEHNRYFVDFSLIPELQALAIRQAVQRQLDGTAGVLKGSLGLLHPEAGANRVDYRTETGSIGVRSAQIVVGNSGISIDTDTYNPYEGLGGFVKHAAVEVIGNSAKRIFGY
jgi:hypothetical protein